MNKKGSSMNWGLGALPGLLNEESYSWVAANYNFCPVQQWPHVTTYRPQSLYFIREKGHLHTLPFTSLYEASQIHTGQPNL